MQELQNCYHKTRHIGIELVPNGTSITFICLLRKKLFFLFCILSWYRDFQAMWENCIVKNKKLIVFYESQYVNLNPGVERKVSILYKQKPREVNIRPYNTVILKAFKV